MHFLILEQKGSPCGSQMSGLAGTGNGCKIAQMNAPDRLAQAHKQLMGILEVHDDRHRVQSLCNAYYNQMNKYGQMPGSSEL